MDILIVIALLAWVFISSANKKKARKQQEEKNRRAVQEAERQQAPQAKQAASAPPLRPQVKPTVQPRQTAPQPQRPHVVQPSRATGHAHTESSMTAASRTMSSFFMMILLLKYLRNLFRTCRN